MRLSGGVVGVLLFVLTLLLSFRGYLVPWDQLQAARRVQL
jgi:quinol-cytochrome oxidoreductase complex cytochrome b subunit